jgi:hypothetical protein
MKSLKGSRVVETVLLLVEVHLLLVDVVVASRNGIGLTVWTRLPMISILGKVLLPNLRMLFQIRTRRPPRLAHLAHLAPRLPIRLQSRSPVLLGVGVVRL